LSLRHWYDSSVGQSLGIIMRVVKQPGDLGESEPFAQLRVHVVNRSQTPSEVPGPVPSILVCLNRSRPSSLHQVVEVSI
jgi:hypothetical protein